MSIFEWLPRIMDGVLFLAGVALACLALACLAQTLRMLLRFSSAIGEVVGFSEDEGCFFPQVRFRPGVDASPVDFMSRTGRGVRGYRVGQPVRVLYRPDKPEEAEIRSPATLWLYPVAFGLLGGLLIAGTSRGLFQ